MQAPARDIREIKHVFVTSNVLPAGTSSNAYTVFLPNFVKDVYRVEVLYAAYWTPFVGSTAVYLDIEELRSPVCSVTATANATTSASITSSTFAVLPGPVYASSSDYTTYNVSINYPIVVDYPYPIQKLDRLTVQWTDQTGRRIDMGTHENSVMLRFYTLRRNAPVVRR
jgi:hypothetical protein